MTRAEALIVLLALPDPSDLRGIAGLPRGCLYRLACKPGMDPELIKRDLGRAYVEHRRHDHRDESDARLAVRTVAWRRNVAC